MVQALRRLCGVLELQPCTKGCTENMASVWLMHISTIIKTWHLAARDDQDQLGNATQPTRQLTVRRKGVQTQLMKQVASGSTQGFRPKSPATDARPAKSSFYQSGVPPLAKENHQD